MTGVSDFVRRGVADPDRLFLYSSSNGASAINQLLTQTRAFRAAVSHGGVSDWLGYYRANQPRGDQTIPNFLGGRKPEDSNDLYIRISPIYQVEKISTPLLLVVGEKRQHLQAGAADTKTRWPSMRPFAKLWQARSIWWSTQVRGNEISDAAAVVEQHVRKAIEFFRSAPSNR